MEELLDELNKVAGAGFYSVALFTSLALPDICAALESEDGRASAAKYKAWFDKWVSPKYPAYRQGGSNLTGEICYAYRCGLLHQGKAMHEKLGYSRVLFLPPSRFTVHNSRMNDALVIDIPHLIKDVTASITEWLNSVRGTENFERHYVNFMKRHKGGLAPYFQGIDVYS
ncbi:hypothetical protein [Pseudomonas putida]|uniref:hypothetical protein n=1 Tax=Pseudomonas putida TaxID=303 RepID=UPI0021678F2A|nr:hypothetical protein [Pseudomonas putida]MCS4063661.1 hypothetical protein [Pseudomonas putida]